MYSPVNPITLDSALSAQTKGSVPAAVLVEEHNYQALLNIGKDGIGQLKLQGPSGMVLIQDAKLNLPALQDSTQYSTYHSINGPAANAIKLGSGESRAGAGTNSASGSATDLAIGTN